MSEVLVSVLVPAYNHESFIRSALDSVLAEGYPRLELIILDDGSRDGTLAVAQNWAAQNASRLERLEVHTQLNQGVCRTANLLIAEARGDFITFLASDDELVPGGIEGRVRALQDHSEWLAVFADAEMIDGEGRLLCESTLVEEFRADLAALKDPKTLPIELILNWCVPGPVFMARRETYELGRGVGPYDENLVFEDREYYLRLLGRKALGFIDAKVARYRLHGQNMCRGESAHPKMGEHFYAAEKKNRPLLRGLEGWALGLSMANLIGSRPRATRLQKLKASLSRRLMRWLRKWNRSRSC